MAFRTTSFTCPACHEALAADAAIAWCKGCNGVWVSEAELEERVRIVRGKSELDLELVFIPDHSSSHAQTRRPCPLCRQPLGHTFLGDAHVDRCDQKHGIWFDPGELELVLSAATRGVGVIAPGGTLSEGDTSSWLVDDTSDVIELIAWVVVGLFD